MSKMREKTHIIVSLLKNEALVPSNRCSFRGEEKIGHPKIGRFCSDVITTHLPPRVVLTAGLKYHTVCSNTPETLFRVTP